jgi:hypothetical protein
LWNRYHQWLPGIKPIQISGISLISASYFNPWFTLFNPSFTAKERVGVQDTCVTCGHHKATIFTSIVHESEDYNQQEKMNQSLWAHKEILTSFGVAQTNW